eukprot:gene12046-16120_t
MNQSILLSSLLALQFGLQPLISNQYCKNVSKTSIVMVTEIEKVLFAIVSYSRLSDNDKSKLCSSWSIQESIRIAALPAVLYSIQNILLQYGFSYLDPTTFNVLNQTKLISSAFWLWIILGKKQSYIQIVSLLLLFIAALILNIEEQTLHNHNISHILSSTSLDSKYSIGVMMVCVASVISGLSSALMQKAFTSCESSNGNGSRDPIYFSAELAIYGIMFLVLSMIISMVISTQTNMFHNTSHSPVQVTSFPSNNYYNYIPFGLFKHWNFWTFIPVTTNALGGIIVAFITKSGGGIVKGFNIIFGLIITVLAEYILYNKPLHIHDWIGLAIVISSIIVYQSFPHNNNNNNNNLDIINNNKLSTVHQTNSTHLKNHVE